MASSNLLEITSATAAGHEKDPTRIDRGMEATYSFPSSITADTLVDLRLPSWGPFGLFPQGPKNSLTVKLEGGEVYYFGLVLPHNFHSIKVRPTKGKGRVEKYYRFKTGYGEEWWSSYVSSEHGRISDGLFGTQISLPAGSLCRQGEWPRASRLDHGR